jgi:uncharacterized membrane protein
MSFHTFGWILAAAFAAFACAISFYLIMMHAMHYSKPYEQKQLVLYLHNNDRS